MTLSKPVGDVIHVKGNRLPIRQAWQLGNVLHVSGQLAFDDDGDIVGEDVVSQTHQTIANIASILTKAGCTTADVFKVTVWLQNVEDFPAFNASYGEYFGDNPPARSAIRADLMAPGALVEIEVQAFVA